MTKSSPSPTISPDPHSLFQQWTRLMGKAQQLTTEFWLKQAQSGNLPSTDPLGMIPTWTEVTTHLLSNPERLADIQTRFWQDSLKLWQSIAGLDAQPKDQGVPEPKISDKRFSAQEWQENQIFDFIRQSYLLTAKYVQETIGGVSGVDPKVKAKAEFFTKQFIDAFAPSNFLLTNPQALKITMEENGQNLLRGLEHLLSDIEQGRISMTDEKAFEVGRNVAVTPGKVVFENRMFQLIQYEPTTQKVFETPLVICPPWINKFYILDLTSEKSFVKWCTEQGVTVFMVSWINPDSSYADTNFEDYMLEGQIKALEVAADICGVPSVNVIGYCVAGTLLASTLAYLHARKRQSLVKSATFFTAQVDFTEAGELCVFVDDEQLETIEKLHAEKGYLDGTYMATTFNLLRSNDLIWSYVVNNYLLGRDPFPFDLLYWNSDATRLPKAMHLYYLKNMYLENNLVKPGALTLGGVPINLTTVKTPCYIQAGKEDHIAPARSVYKITQHFKGPMRFILAGSGHIAGVVNPPASNKYQYWTNDVLPSSFDDFVQSATEHKGSWWPDWIKWLGSQSGKKAPARHPGEHVKYPAIEEAPGRYVKVK